MVSRPISLRSAAREDLRSAVRYYASEAGEQVALGFTAAFDAANRFIAENPAAGSPRYAGQLGLPRLRYMRLNGYPYLVFYVEGPADIEVWRVLHASRDIPASLQDK